MPINIYWNDLWDKSVPALLGEANVIARAPSGAISEREMVVRDPGFGYGSEAVVASVDATVGEGAILQPVVSNGRIVSVTVLAGGHGYDPREELKVRITRRPPLHVIAQARATVQDGAIKEITLTDETKDANGYYVKPPFIVIHDRGGTGGGAEFTAILNAGRIVGFRPVQRGQDYSSDVAVGIYTSKATLPEISILDRTAFSAPSVADFSFRDTPYHFGDTRARHLYFLGAVSSRFRSYVKDPTSLATPPRRLELRSSARPPKPDLAHLMPAYNTDRQVGAARFVYQRTGAIRCYLHRPWNVTGDEFLGGVVMTAERNTIKVKQDPTGDLIIPRAYRPYISRWGFDPAWDEAYFAPLTLDDFSNAVSIVRYERLAEAAGVGESPVGLALHEVSYDRERDLWYGDIAVRPPATGAPFVQLALVRYQPHSVPGLSISEVVLADPIVHPGYRCLEVQRGSDGHAAVSLRGNFDALPRGNSASKFPQRRVVVELRRKIAGASDDLEGHPALDRWHLDRGQDAFTGKIRLDAKEWTDSELYLAIKELEVFRTAAAQRDSTGLASKTIDQYMSFERLVFYGDIRTSQIQ